LTIPVPVLQRLIDGKTLGLALTPLGSIEAAFYAREERDGAAAARLLINFDEHLPLKIVGNLPSRGGEGCCLDDPRPRRGDPRSGGNRTTGARGAGELEAYPEPSRREGSLGNT
jgi:hypothetical protein